MWDLINFQPKLNNARTNRALRILKSLNKVTKNKTLIMIEGKDRGKCINLLLEEDWKTDSNKMGTHSTTSYALYQFKMILSLFHSYTHTSETHLSS